MEILIGKTELLYACTAKMLNDIAIGKNNIICKYCVWEEICQEQPKEKCKDFESGEE